MPGGLAKVSADILKKFMFKADCSFREKNIIQAKKRVTCEDMQNIVIEHFLNFSFEGWYENLQFEGGVGEII